MAEFAAVVWMSPDLLVERMGCGVGGESIHVFIVSKMRRTVSKSTQVERTPFNKVKQDRDA